jgi:hypothetical protein
VALPHLRDLPEEKETSAASTCYPFDYSSESFHRLGLHPEEEARSRHRTVQAVAGGNCHRQIQEEEEQTVHERVHHHQEVEDTLG